MFIDSREETSVYLIRLKQENVLRSTWLKGEKGITATQVKSMPNVGSTRAKQTLTLPKHDEKFKKMRYWEAIMNWDSPFSESRYWEGILKNEQLRVSKGWQETSNLVVKDRPQHIVLLSEIC